MSASREIMLCVEKQRDKDDPPKVYRIAKVTKAQPLDQWVLAMPYKNRTVTVVSLPPQIIDRALAMGCKRWVVRFEPAMVCLSFPLDQVKSKGWYKLTGKHHEYFVKLDKFTKTEWQNWPYTGDEEIVPWTEDHPITEESELPDLFDEEMLLKAKITEDMERKALAVLIPPEITPEEISAKIIKDAPVPKSVPIQEPVVVPLAPELPVLQFLRPSTVASSKPTPPAPVTDAPEALVSSLEQSIALITERKVILTIMRSANHPVMGEMWIGVFKIVPGSGYGDHLSPIIGGTPIEVAMAAAFAVGKGMGQGR